MSSASVVSPTIGSIIHAKVDGVVRGLLRCGAERTWEPGKMTTSTGSNVERIGHRGAPRRYLENTTASFREALRLGGDAIELDVHVTSDGLPVVHHDPVLSARVTPTRLVRKGIDTLDRGE